MVKFDMECMALFDLIPCGLYIVKEHKIIYCNKTAIDIFEFDSKDDLIGLNPNTLASDLQYDGELSKDKGQRIFESILKNNDEDNSFQWLYKKKTEETFLANIKIFVREGLFYVAIWSVEENYKLKQQVSILNNLFSNLPYAVTIIDADLRIKEINENFIKLFQYNLEEIINKKIVDILDSYNQLDLINQSIEFGFDNDAIKQVGMRRRKDGSLVEVEIIINPIVLYGKIIGFCNTYIDISHKQKDSLTNLYNKSYFFKAVEKRIESHNNQEFSIIFIGVEKFKEVNDTMGHMAGDKLLYLLSKRLEDVALEGCTLSRFSGVEFIIMCNKFISKEEMRTLAFKILDIIKKPFLIEDKEIHITAKIGISMYPQDGNSADLLIRYADIAMTYAKLKSDTSICFYSNEMAEEIEMKFHLNNYLTSAVRNNELIIHYQPIVDIRKNNEMVGAEALLRWNSPIFGMVHPNDFIPLIEESGEIIDIGYWIIEAVCRQINTWKAKGYRVKPISINVSVKQLEQFNFATRFLDIIVSNKVDANLVELEITESVSSGDIEKIVNNLRTLKSAGLKFSMDDFGTGFSSLGQLDIFELDKLKIDKMFIDNMLNITKRQSLVKTIIAMANSLGLTVVAEGIETSEQLAYLRKNGCHLGQGYIFSKAIPAEEIEYLLEKTKKYSSTEEDIN